MCGVSILHLSKIAKFCGGGCRAAFHEDRVDAHLERMREPRACAWCGADISSLSGVRRYCSESCSAQGVREISRDWHRARRSEDPDAARERDRDYYARRSARVKAKVHRRRGRVEGGGSCVVTERDLERLLSAPCAYCDCCPSSEIDHVVPIARGGRDAIGNLIGACSFCNRSKNDRFLVEWRRSLREGVVSTHAFSG